MSILRRAVRAAALLAIVTACSDRAVTMPSSVPSSGARSDLANGTGVLRVDTWYDANVSGTWDAGENAIDNWPIAIPALGSGPFFTTYIDYDTPEGDYTITEANPVQSNWYTTRNGGAPSAALRLTGSAVASQPAHVDAGGTTFAAFGNVCFGGAGARGVGYWGSSSGQATLFANGGDGIVFLNQFVPFPNGSSNYGYWRNANGSRVSYTYGSGVHYGFANFNAFRTWATSATATNMAYMLSVQLAAAKLNIATGFVWSGEIVYAPGTIASPVYVPSFNDYWDLADEAQALLYANGAATLSIGSGSALRARAQALKDALERANTNVGFVQHSPCPLSF